MKKNILFFIVLLLTFITTSCSDSKNNSPIPTQSYSITLSGTQDGNIQISSSPTSSGIGSTVPGVITIYAELKDNITDKIIDDQPVTWHTVIDYPIYENILYYTEHKQILYFVFPYKSMQVSVKATYTDNGTIYESNTLTYTSNIN